MIFDLLWDVGRVYLSYRLLRTLFALLQSVFVYHIVPRFWQPDLDKFRVRWTVVTGGTDGIGKAYTYELARRGIKKFVLIGRSAQKLSDVKGYLELNHNADVKTYLFDFAKDDYNRLRAFINAIDVGLVINSVGVGRENLERYGDNPEADSMIMRVNALGSAEFLSMVLPTMERHGGGQIVVLSSSQGFRVIPGLATYCAAKSVMSFLSEAIDREYTSIRVQCLTPALVATNMTYYKNSEMFVVTADSFAREAVSTLGLVRVTTGCFNHEIQMLCRHLLPWAILKHAIMPVYWLQQRRLDQLHAQTKKEAHITIVPRSAGVA
ncbi:dhs-5 [Pristionchus pacificus]|uniref:Dhs-5 n=1 Tax=Pristionchus pacificus TaxID=54126 RepID=A0A2A6CZC8_PRIPA|nr:dhs-5 [Pristionchus pacificus]|eukprot:PDM83417.1 dhs-5 [Pristionchus pacificus]